MDKVRRKTLDRDLGLFAVMSISMGAMLGSGIFVLPGLAVAKSGNALALAYLISALVVLPAALAKCEMATALPQSGGTYLFVDRSIGPLAGTVVGMGTWFSLVFKSAFALVGLGGYFKILFPGLPSKVALGLAIGAGLVILNLLGAKKSTKFQSAVVALALTGLTVFAIGAGGHVEAARLEGFFQVPASTVLSTAGFVFVSFAGVTKIASVAEEVRDPDRTIPLGILLSLGIVTLIYILITVILVSAMPISVISGSVTPLAAATAHLWGAGLASAMALLAVLTLTSMANSGLLSSSRYPLAMSRDHLLPEFLSAVNARFRTPANSILFTGALLLSLVWLVPVEELAKLASAFQLLLFAAVNVSLVVVRESGARWYKPTFRSPLYPLVPMFGIVSALVLLFTMGRVAWLGAGGIVSGGLLWYVVFVRGRVQRRGAGSRLYGEFKRATNRYARPRRVDAPRSGVLVPIFDNDDEEVDELIPLAAMLARRDCQIEVLRIEEVPDQLALGDVEEVDPITQQIAAHVEAVESSLGIPCSFEDVVTHHVKHALFERATEQGTNWIVRAWPRRSPWRLIPDPTAWFIHHPPCNLLLFRDMAGAPGQGIKRFQRVVVLAEPGPHDALVIHVADRLAQTTGASLTFVYLVPSDVDEEEVEGLRRYHKSLDPMFPTEVGEAEVIRSKDDLATAIALCQDYDLLVLGAPPQSEARGLLRGSFEDQMIERAPCAVLRVMAVRGLPHANLSFPSAVDEVTPASPGERLAHALEHMERVPADRLQTKKQLFTAVAQGLESRLGYPLTTSVEEALWERERKQGTALGEGIAVPHFTHAKVERYQVELWILEAPLDYEDKAAEQVDLVFALAIPPGERQAHLQTLAAIGRMAQAGLLDRLRQATSLEEVRTLLLGGGEAAIAN